jgi:hypothetical protein
MDTYYGYLLWLLIMVTSSHRFEGTNHLHLQGYGSVISPITLKMNAVCFSETSGRGCNSPDDLVPQQSVVGNLK